MPLTCPYCGWRDRKPGDDACVSCTADVPDPPVMATDDMRSRVLASVKRRGEAVISEIAEDLGVALEGQPYNTFRTLVSRLRKAGLLDVEDMERRDFVYTLGSRRRVCVRNQE